MPIISKQIVPVIQSSSESEDLPLATAVPKSKLYVWPIFFQCNPAFNQHHRSPQKKSLPKRKTKKEDGDDESLSMIYLYFQNIFMYLCYRNEEQGCAHKKLKLKPSPEPKVIVSGKRA